MKHWWVIFIIILIIGFIFLYGCYSLGERLAEKRFNDGYCQICGEKVIPVGSRYEAQYYCSNCRRWNK